MISYVAGTRNQIFFLPLIMTFEKAILVTGAAGGLGRAIVAACRAAMPDYRIVATDITGLPQTHPAIIKLKLDVTNEASIAAVREAIEAEGLRVYGLINNAGISDFFPISEKPGEQLDRVFSINTFGPVNMVRAFLPHLIETSGRVVNISSESVRLPASFHPYASSKIAMEALSVSMRNELSLKGVRLSIVRPGAIATPFLNDLEAMKERIGNSIYRDKLLRFAEVAPTQIHRIIKPEKVAKVIIKALVQKKPRRYYHINNNPKLMIAAVLPHRLRDTLMKRVLEEADS